MKDGYVVALGPVDVDEYYRCTTPLLPGAKCFVRKEEDRPADLEELTALFDWSKVRRGDLRLPDWL